MTRHRAPLLETVGEGAEYKTQCYVIHRRERKRAPQREVTWHVIQHGLVRHCQRNRLPSRHAILPSARAPDMRALSKANIMGERFSPWPRALHRVLPSTSPSPLPRSPLRDWQTRRVRSRPRPFTWHRGNLHHLPAPTARRPRWSLTRDCVSLTRDCTLKAWIRPLN